MIVNSKFYLTFFRICPLIIIFFILGGLYDLKISNFENIFERNTIIYFGMFIPALIIFNIVMLTKLVENISLDKEIIINFGRLFSNKLFSINPADLKEIRLKNGNSDILKLILKDQEMNIQIIGLKDFEGNWLEPNYNQLMPSNPNAKNAHKIAFNISKKYNIPFESEFIN